MSQNERCRQGDGERQSAYAGAEPDRWRQVVVIDGAVRDQISGRGLVGNGKAEGACCGRREDSPQGTFDDPCELGIGSHRPARPGSAVRAAAQRDFKRRTRFRGRLRRAGARAVRRLGLGGFIEQRPATLSARSSLLQSWQLICAGKTWPAMLSKTHMLAPLSVTSTPRTWPCGSPCTMRFRSVSA